MTYVPCPHCGADIREDAKFCRHCGSSDSDGWRDEWESDEDDDEGYEEFIEREFSGSQTSTTLAPHWRFVAAVLLLLIAFVAWTYLQAMVQQ